MISKELLSEVLGNKIGVVYTQDHLGNKFKTFVRPRYGDFVDEINIYELAFKCKQWAWANGFQINTRRHTLHSDISSVILYSNGIIAQAIGTYNTEPEAIFKAGEWILENK